MIPLRIKPNHTRKPHKKTRLGCKTCKARRVKCGEEKPICFRCRDFGIKCDGYSSSAKSLLLSSDRPLNPRSQSGSARVLVPLHASPLIARPLTRLFDTDQEQRYFTLFSEQVAADISPYFDAAAWTRMILQACFSEPSVRHAAVALGALGKTFEIIESGRNRNSGATFSQFSHGRPSTRMDDDEETTRHHENSLKQYDKAIKRMRADISGANQNIRTALISCVIIICFESLHGNHESATAQLASGISLVQDWKYRQQDASKHPQGFSSPAPHVIEDFLVQIFGRLEIQAMSFLDPRPIECHHNLKQEGKDLIGKMPKRLVTINQARVYLDLIMRRMMHFTASLNHFKVSYAQYKMFPEPSKSTPWIDSKIDSKVDLPDMLKHHAERDALSDEMNAWLKAFKPLLSKCAASNASEYVSALTMLLAAKTSAISLSTAFIVSETEYDVFEPDFRSIVSHAAELLEKLKQCRPRDRPALAFAFDLGVIPPLYLTMTKCRATGVRRRALQLLQKHPRREGLWDSVTTASIGAWVIEMEEEGLKEGLLAENNRVRKASIKSDLVKRTGVMTCLKFEEGTGRMVEIKKELCW